jgi:hypothetical protein
MAISWKDDVENASVSQLHLLGFSNWDGKNADGKTLWLVPVGMYDAIPEGTELENINGKKIIFKRGVTDRDQRYGALAYGIRR